jgi:NAD(P)-dependent dehydrogenase (short-subunit alcohol dehydrogenase family)
MEAPALKPHPLAQESPLAGRVVALTGASRGIGRALAELLHGAGAKVIAGARSPTVFAHEAIVSVALDVSDESSVQAFAQLAIGAGVDSLVNNAGIGIFGAIEFATVEDYRKVFDTNVLGTLLTTKHFIPEFKRRHDRGLPSRLVNITSDVSARTFAGGGIYTASKHAQRALTQTAAWEGERYGLRVTEVRSGMTDTHFNGHTPGTPERAGHLRAHDVAGAVLYALSAPPHVRVDEIVLHPTVQPVVF